MQPPGVLMGQQTLPEREARIFSLSTIWKELQYNFAFPEKLQQANIDSLYWAYLPKIEQVKSYYEYYYALSGFMAHLNEAHTRIYSLSERLPYDIPPLKVINFGEKIIVNNVAKNVSDQIPTGSEIVKINHIPVAEYMTDSIYPHISASTPQWKLDKSVIELLNGEPQSKVIITVKTPKGKVNEVEMIRNYNVNNTMEEMVDDKPFSPIDIKIMEGNIGYIRLPTFLSQYVDTINTVFISHLPQLRKCEGLIIDIRENRGGTDEAWTYIACITISESKFQRKGKWFTRIHHANSKRLGRYSPQYSDYYQGTAMEELKYPPFNNPLNDTLKLHQPLIVISGIHTASAAENFLTVMKETGRATVVGEPSAGCMGTPMYIPLYGGLGVMLCVCKYVNPDGTQLNDTGILPDIEVKNDYDAYLKGKDCILEQAIAELRKQIILFNEYKLLK
jgi:C-terminal processing protease CtpA/Prc